MQPGINKTLCMNYIFHAAFSLGVRSHPYINAHCVFATASLASGFQITLLFPCVCSSCCKDTDRAGGRLQRCKYLKECHFNFMLEVERAVSASGIFGRVFIPVCCEACARAREVAATESLSPPHTPASLQD